MKTYSILLVTLLLCSCERDTDPIKEPEPTQGKHQLEYLKGEYDFVHLDPPELANSSLCQTTCDFNKGFTLKVDSIGPGNFLRFGGTWFRQTDFDSSMFTLHGNSSNLPIGCSSKKAPGSRLVFDNNGARLINHHDDGMGEWTLEVRFSRK